MIPDNPISTKERDLLHRYPLASRIAGVINRFDGDESLVVELEAMLKNCQVGKVFVTAFGNFTEFRKHTPEIAWETEVWLADIPDHMIHYNGDKFFGTR